MKTLALLIALSVPAIAPGETVVHVTKVVVGHPTANSTRYTVSGRVRQGIPDIIGRHVIGVATYDVVFVCDAYPVESGNVTFRYQCPHLTAGHDYTASVIVHDKWFFADSAYALVCDTGCFNPNQPSFIDGIAPMTTIYEHEVKK